MRGASASGPAAQTRRPGADARRAARTPGAAASSTTPGREDEGNSTARQQYLSRPPHPEVAEAACTGEWQPCMRWTLGNLLEAVQQGAEVADSVGLSMWEGGPRMQEWLHTMLTNGIQWDLGVSQLMATAYLHTLTLQPTIPTGSAEARTMSTFTSNMRDVLIVGAIIQAGTHRNKAEVITALCDIFRGEVSKEMNSQMQHSYHQLLRGAAYAYQSTCARGRRRRPRIRPSHDESATDVATEDEPEADEADESDAAETSAAESSESAPLRSKAVLRHIEAERTKLWRGMCGLEARQQRDEDARLELEMKLSMQLRMLCEEIRGLKAHATHLEAKVAHLEAQQGKSAPCPLSTPCPYPAAVQSEEWLRRNPAPFGDSSQVVEIPILCLRWRGWDCDYMNKAMTSQPSQPEEVLGQQCADVPVTFHEPLGVVQHKRFFWVLAADVEQQTRLAAVAMFQGLSKHKMVMTPCKICRGSLRGSSSSAAPAHFDPDLLAAAADVSDEDLLSSNLLCALSDEEQQ